MAKIEEKILSLRARLQELEAEQRLKERAARQAERQRARKAENQRKYQLGGLFKLAGIFDVDVGALMGMLLTMQPLLADPERFREFKLAGDAFLAQRETERREKTNSQPPHDESYLQ